MSNRYVIGIGPDALRAAAVLATGEQRVSLLTESASPSGRGLPALPVGTGRIRCGAEGRALVEQVLGPLTEYPVGGRGVAFGGKVHRLPLAQATVPTLFPAAELPGAARTWAAARLRNATRQLMGSGTEERSYRDWVVRRMGASAYANLYRSYAERRWGLPAEELSVAVARLFHGKPEEPGTLTVAAGEAAALQHAEGLLRGAAGEVRTGVTVEGLVVRGGRVAAVRTAEGEIPVEGPLWVARAPSVVVGWLGEALDSGPRVDGAALTSRQLVQVSFQGDVSGLPAEIHVLDEGAPFYRAVRPVGTQDLLVLHATLDAGAEAPPPRLVADRFVPSARQLGLGTLDPDTVQVEVLPEQQPVWGRVCHARLRRLLLRFRELGVVLVGRTGAFGYLDPGAEIGLAASYRDEQNPDQREAQRVLTDPPILLDDLEARITRFIER